MNTSKSLESILLTYLQDHSKAQAHGRLQEHDNATNKAKAAIVEAVEGLIPLKKGPKFEANLKVIGFHEQYVEGYNKAVDEFLQAIKEWQ